LTDAVHVERRDGVYVLVDTRVSLDSVVYAFVSGQSAETIAQAFSALTLEQVYGAIAFYLAHRADVDRYLEERRVDYNEKREASRNATRRSTRSLPTRRGRRPQPSRIA
jgi:uncharacterized protein (DUF433 family)